MQSEVNIKIKKRKDEISNPETIQRATLLHVEIPSGLMCLPTETVKFCAFYLLLKAVSPESGWILNYTGQIHTIALHFWVLISSFFIYMGVLKKMKYDDRIRIVGWRQFGHSIKINPKERKTILFSCDKDKFSAWLKKNHK